MKTIDCRGLNCPEPVLRTKNALENYTAGKLKIIVDNQVARDNVMRFLRSKNLQPESHESGGSYQISADPGAIQAEKDAPFEKEAASSKKQEFSSRPVLFISTDQLGKGSSELGRLLIRNFIYTLTRRDEMPGAVVFMNAGVKLSIAGSPALEELRELENNGVEILVCGTCLDYYDLTDQHLVGQVSNMYDIADLLMDSERVVTI